MPTSRRALHCIVPPYMLAHLARSLDPKLRALARAALETALVSERLRGHRVGLGALASHGGVSPGTKRRTIYDAGGLATLPGKLVRGEGDAPTKDVAVNEAYDGLGATYDFYLAAYARNSIDGKGQRLDASVHYREKYDNAFWDGRQMIFGDGDGVLFTRFTRSVDVIGHELTHGVTQHEADLAYEGQSGALNESFSDVFGSLVKQMQLGQTAAAADWLIGAGLFTEGVHGTALRSMKAPGTAYDDPRLGKDPQPATMAGYVETDEDNGGVHVNSGIPNRAFYPAAIAMGGRAWEGAGRAWYDALTGVLKSNAKFVDAAQATTDAAGSALGKDAAKAVAAAWTTVGVRALAARKTTKGRAHAHSDRAQRRVRRDKARKGR